MKPGAGIGGGGRHLVRRARRQRGQSMVELALTSTVLMFLSMGLLDFGRAFYWDSVLHNAAREGARHGAWYDQTLRYNPYLDQADIKSAVDSVLTQSGLPASTLVSGCPSPSDGNGVHNPPYVSSTYPAAANSPQLYICYANGNSSLPASTPPASSSSYWQQDLDVVVVMSYGLITQFMQSELGNQIRMVGITHMAVQGHS